MVAALALAGALGAQSAAADKYVTLTLENDFFAGKDSGYSNDIGFGWARDGFDSFDGELPGWLHWLSEDLYISTMPSKRRAVSYTLAQAMYTPEDLDTTVLIKDEAPYAGLLRWSGTLHAFDAHTADSLSLTLGLVGPGSGAKRAQKAVHSLIGANTPKGWHHQLRNEPVFQISAERLLRLGSLGFDNGTGLDLIGIGRGELGTLKSQLLGGFGVRYGHGLDRSFPTATVLPNRSTNRLPRGAAHSWQVYLNLLGSYVFNDIVIDGNTFSSSHSVPLRHWQAMSVAGFEYSFGRFAVNLSAVSATARYEGEHEPPRFGSVSLTYRY